jgi:hypothetical protein
MVSHTVTLTDTENKAFSAYAVSQQEWIDNSVHERCRSAINAICKICVDKCLETQTQIPNSQEGMVDLAFQMGWVKTAQQQNEEAQAAFDAQVAAAEAQRLATSA